MVQEQKIPSRTRSRSRSRSKKAATKSTTEGAIQNPPSAAAGSSADSVWDSAGPDTLFGPFISTAGLKAIASHKYVGCDYTPLEVLVNKYVWQPGVELLPMWLAPNAVTLLGLLCHFVYFFSYVGLLLLTDVHSEASDLPAWVHGMAAFLFWLYSVLDALDGKQARRTGNSSPLGQLLDHGCDFLASLALLPFAFGHAVRWSGTSDELWFLLFNAVSTFGAQWEEAHTGQMRTNIGAVFGVTEACYLISAVFGVSAVMGDGWWLNTVVLSLPVVNVAVQLTYAQVFLVSTGLTSVWAAGNFLHRVCIEHGKWSALADWVPIAGVLSTTIILYSNGGDQLVLYPGLTVVLGVVLAHLCTQRIVTSMSKEVYSQLQAASTLFTVLAADAVVHGGFQNGFIASMAPDLGALVSLLGWAVTSLYFNYVCSVLIQLSLFLGQPIVTLKQKPVAKAE
jgi:phosphatidylglycerophosphate synthase